MLDKKSEWVESDKTKKKRAPKGSRPKAVPKLHFTMARVDKLIEVHSAKDLAILLSYLNQKHGVTKEPIESPTGYLVHPQPRFQSPLQREPF